MIFGVGINDLNSKVKSYSTWHSMHRRCYSTVYDNNHGGYSNCKVSKPWQLLSNYDKWFNLNYTEGYQLDKDLIGDSLEYSETSCLFLPPEINQVLQQDKGKNGLPPGVSYKTSHNKYIAQMSKTQNGIRKSYHLCISSDSLECFKVYKTEKEKYIKELAENYKLEIRTEIYKALIDYKVKY